MKLTKYAEAIAQSKDQQVASLAPLRAVETQKRIELRIAELDTQRTSREAEVANMAGRYPLDIASLTNAMDNLALLERQIAQLKEVTIQLFPPAA